MDSLLDSIAAEAPNAPGSASLQARLWADSELAPVAFSIRPLSRVMGGKPDRVAFGRLILEHGQYFEQSDMWDLPSMERSVDQWSNGSGRVVAAAFDGNGSCVGFCGADLDQIQIRDLNLWYGVAPLAQGRGLARELARQATSLFLERHPKTIGVTLCCSVKNLASQAVALALGLVRREKADFQAALGSEAPVRDYLSFGGSTEDVLRSVQQADEDQIQMADERGCDPVSAQTQFYERLRA